MNNIDLIIFDLDGTLLNTIADICGSMNRILAKHGCQQYTVEECKKFIGRGSMALLRAALGEGYDEEFYKNILAEYLECYENHAVVDTEIFSGIPEMLAKLQEMGVKLAVLSNKPDVLTKKIIKICFPEIEFMSVNGQKDGVPLKPDPTATLQIITAAKTTQERTLFVGDSPEDWINAVNSGTNCALVPWGYNGREVLERLGADHIIDKPEDIFKFV